MYFKHAIVLSGGLGTRLGLLGKRLPKPLISIAGKTPFERYSDQLVDIGVTCVEWVFAEQYKSQVESFLKQHIERYPLEITVTYEPVQLGITKAFIDQAPKVSKKTLFLLGDVFFTESFAASCPDVSKTSPIVLGVSRPPLDTMKDNCNVTFTPENYITRILDKPTANEIKGPWAWDGWFLIHPSFFDHVSKLNLDPKTMRNYLIGDLFEQLREIGVEFIAAPERHWHINLNTRADIRRAEKYLAQKENK